MGDRSALPNLRPITPACSAMATPHRPSGQPLEPWAWSAFQQRRHLLRCWQVDCDLDPMILRARLLRHQGSLPQATCVEQELLPLF
jgi:hypothetical protein